MIFITGATSGIGKACAQAFAAQKIPLFLTGRREDRLRKLKTDLSTITEVRIATLDIRDRKAVEQLVERESSALSQTTVLINNAGLAKGRSPLGEGDPSDWDDMIDTNIKGLLYCTKALLPTLVKNRGHIVNIGSIAGRWVYPDGNVYCATKHAVRALTEAMRLDLHGKNVRVTTIDPGMVETEFSLVRFHQDAEKAKSVYAGATPLQPHDIAESVAWAISRPAHVNIQEMVIYPTSQASPALIERK